MINNYLERVWEEAYDANTSNIIRLLPQRPALLVDLGCDDGSLTREVSEAIGAERVTGVEIDPERAAIAADRDIEVFMADINDPLPLEDRTAEAVMANQLIEHLCDTDNLLSEASRILVPGGSLVVSTENLASWHNLFALVLGWQPFSLTNISSMRTGLGNPAALHRDRPGRSISLQHLRVFAYRGLIELMEAHGLECRAVLGAGYFPMGGSAARGLSRLDPRHSAFLSVLAVKPHDPPVAGPDRTSRRFPGRS